MKQTEILKTVRKYPVYIWTVSFDYGPPKIKADSQNPSVSQHFETLSDKKENIKNALLSKHFRRPFFSISVELTELIWKSQENLL